MSVLNQTIAYFKIYLEQQTGIKCKDHDDARKFLKELLEEKEQDSNAR